VVRILEIIEKVIEVMVPTGRLLARLLAGLQGKRLPLEEMGIEFDKSDAAAQYHPQYEALAYDPKYHEAWGCYYFQRGLDDLRVEWFEQALAAFSKAAEQTQSVEEQVRYLAWQALAKVEIALLPSGPSSAFNDAFIFVDKARSLADKLPEGKRKKRVLGYIWRLRAYVYHSQGNIKEAQDSYWKTKEVYKYHSQRFEVHKQRADQEKGLPRRFYTLRVLVKQISPSNIAPLCIFMLLSIWLTIFTVMLPWLPIARPSVLDGVSQTTFRLYQMVAVRLSRLLPFLLFLLLVLFLLVNCLWKMLRPLKVIERLEGLPSAEGSPPSEVTYPKGTPSQ